MTRPRPAGKRRRLHGVALACAVVGGSVALAATPPTPPADPDLATENLRRLGPFQVRPFATLKDTGYDDNIRFEAPTAEGDYTATAGAGVDALLAAGSRGGIRLFAEADYVAFLENTDLDHWNTFGRGRGLYALRRVLLSLEDGYSSVEERPNSEVDARLRRKNNAITGALRTLGTGRLTLKTFLRGERIDYSSEDPSLQDDALRLTRDETTLSVIGEARLLRKTVFTLQGAVSRIEFDDPTERRDSRKRAILPGVRFDPSAVVQGELQAGPLVLTPLERDDGEYRGVVGDAHLRMRAGRRARVKANLSRNVEFSTFATNLYYVAGLWSAAWEQFFSRRVSAEISYGRGLNHYPEKVQSAQTPGVFLVRDDHLTTSGASVSYRANPQMSIVAGVSRVRRDSTDDFYDKARNFYTFGTRYDF